MYNIYFHPLAGFPGPKLYAGSNLPKMIQQVRGNVHGKMLELHQKYGPVVRLAPDELTYTSATALREIYGNRGGSSGSGGNGGGKKGGGGGGGPMPPQTSLGRHDEKMFGATAFIWLVSHEEHLHHRRVLAPSFSDASLRAQEPIVLGHERLLAARLRERVARGDDVVDLWAWFNFLTFDVIGDLTFGEPFGCVDEGRFHPWIAFIFSNLTNMMYAQMVATMGPLGNLLELLAPRRIWAEALSHAQATRDKVDRRLARGTGTGTDGGGTARADFVSGFEGRVDRPGGISSRELYADANVFIMAGSETSATLLAVATYYLLRSQRGPGGPSPCPLARLRAEVRGAFAREADVTFAAAARLPYLLAVVHEALRIHPPLPAGINRTVPAGGAVIDGRFVAAGTILQVPHWPAFHLAENFADPWEFVPERWLPEGQRPARYDGDNRDVFQPFSYGQRNCIGRSLAYAEVKTMLARLMLAFDMELMPESLDWNKQRSYLLWEKRPLYVKLSEAMQCEEQEP